MNIQRSVKINFMLENNPKMFLLLSLILFYDSWKRANMVTSKKQNKQSKFKKSLEIVIFIKDFVCSSFYSTNDIFYIRNNYLKSESNIALLSIHSFLKLDHTS